MPRLPTQGPIAPSLNISDLLDNCFKIILTFPACVEQAQKPTMWASAPKPQFRQNKSEQLLCFQLLNSLDFDGQTCISAVSAAFSLMRSM